MDCEVPFHPQKGAKIGTICRLQTTECEVNVAVPDFAVDFKLNQTQLAR